MLRVAWPCWGTHAGLHGTVSEPQTIVLGGGDRDCENVGARKRLGKECGGGGGQSPWEVADKANTPPPKQTQQDRADDK